MRFNKSGKIVPLTLFIAASCLSVQAQETQLYWGDTHLHSSYSVDAYSTGNYTADPETAYRFARGLPVLSPVTGQRIRIERPLDFLIVSDHSEMLQLQVSLSEGHPAWLGTPSGERLAQVIDENPRSVFLEVAQIGHGGGEELLRDFHTDNVRGTAWSRQTALADQYNEPGVFTSFIGWEWSAAPDWANLHRVIFTPDNADVANQFLPISYYDTEAPEDVWDWLDETAARTGADFIAIPHNSNMSDGKMFPMADSDGRPLTVDYTRTRARWEPVMEITQVKGNSETMPELSPDDPFASFEVRNKLLINEPAAISMGSYARGALRQGLALEQRTGTNPYKFGMIGSSDIHSGIAETSEYNFYGKFVNDSLPANRVAMQGNFPAWETSASGLAAVWAEKNTRDSIFSAFRKKEVYATTGTRISLRMFGGFDFVPEDADTTDIAATGYAGGVPMGGDLTTAPAGKTVTFLIRATKDPIGANLDRIQVIKGWLDDEGQTHEQVVDVVWSGNRQTGENGQIVAVGNTVDVETASYTDTIGSAELSAVWEDPNFDPQQQAFYYVRVLEIPTPRHHVYDAVALGVDPDQSGMPATIQERAYSSPIWYSPE